jgi:hypothetical protein
MKYEKFLTPVFDKCVEITNNNIDNGKTLQIDINNHNNHAMNRRKGFCYSKPTTYDESRNDDGTSTW